MKNAFSNNKCARSAPNGINGRRQLDYTRGQWINNSERNTDSKELELFKKIFTKNSKIIPIDDFDVVMFHNWFDNVLSTYRKYTITTTPNGTVYGIEFEQRNGEAKRMVRMRGVGRNKRLAYYDIVCKLYGHVDFQMMESGIDGTAEVSEVVASNTVITEPVVDSVAGHDEVNVMAGLCANDPSLEVPLLTDRFEVLAKDEIRRDTDYSYNCVLPRDIIGRENGKNSANLLAFHNFIYSNLKMEMRVVVNSPKFGQGRLILGWLPDSASDLVSMYDDYSSLLQRQHVFIDLNANNQAVVEVPQNIRRTLIRNFKHETSSEGQTTAEMATFQIRTLVNYTSTADQPATIPVRIFYRFVNADMFGMSFGVQLQMDRVLDLAGDVYPPIRTAEKMLKRFGFIGNQDKPYEASKSVVVPTPRRDFCSGSGLSDATPLFFDNMATVTTLSEYMNPNDPKNMLDIARIMGYLGRFEWKTTDLADATIWEWFVLPTSRTGWECPSLQQGGEWKNRQPKRRPTPLDYVSSHYAFYRGSIKLKFLFIGTQFHTGTVQFEISYNRISTDMNDMASTYTKTFELTEEREYEFEVPYIYDTPWRPTMKQFQWPSTAGDMPGLFRSDVRKGYMEATTILSAAQMYPPGIEFNSNTRVTVRVINPLTPISTVAKQVTVVVLVGAGSDFTLMGIVPNFYSNPAYARLDENDQYSGQVHNLRQYPIFTTNIGDESLYPNQQRVPRARAKVARNMVVGEALSLHHTIAGDLAAHGAKWGTPGEYRAIRYSRDGSRQWLEDYTTDQLHAYDVGRIARPAARPKYVKKKRNLVSFQGPDTRHFHNTDNHLDFKNLLRRNYLLLSATVNKRQGEQSCMWRTGWQESNDTADAWYETSSRFYLPVCPPTHGICANEFSDCWSSPISTIPSLFRHWRGSMRYVVVSSGGKPVTIAYLPNLGTTMLGNKIQGNVLRAINNGPSEWTGKNFRVITSEKLASTGLACELLIPAVNPSASIMAPFDTMINRCVTCVRPEKGNNENIEEIIARDESTFHSGHLILESEVNSPVDIYISSGDDFQMMNFIGTMEYDGLTTIGATDMYVRHKNGEDGAVELMANFRIDQVSTPRTTPEVNYQMFGISEMVENLNGKIDSAQVAMADVTKSVSEASKSIRTETKKLNEKVGTSLDTINETIKRGVDEHASVSDSFLEHIKNISGNFQKSTDQIQATGESMKRVMELLAPSIERTKSMFESIGDAGGSMFDLSRDFIFDLILLLRNFDYTNFGILFIKYIAKVLGLGWETLVHQAESLAQIVKRICGRESKEQGSDSKTPFPSLFAFFVSLIAGALKLTNMPERKIYDYGSSFKDFVFDSRNVSYMNNMITLVERIFKMFAEAVTYVRDYSNTEETVLKILKEEESEIQRFCVEVDEITNPANSRIAQRNDVKAKTWRNFMYSKYLLKKMVQCKGNPASAVIMKYINKITTYCETNWTKLACSPVRYEPRVYCIAGDSNVGKSYLSKDIILTLLSEIGYKRIGAQPIFTRAPGRKHWDGYTLDKQAIVFDDWLNISNPDQVVEQVSDLYELKSTCDFLPAMAAVDEKGIRANPKIIALLTNTPFPNSCLDTVCNSRGAVYRRRDKLIWARIRGEYRDTNLRKLSPEESKSFAHLEFAFGDPTRVHDQTDPLLKWMDYTKLEEALKEDFRDYHMDEMEHVKRRMDSLCADLPDGVRKLIDPMEIYSLRQFEVALGEEGFEESLPSRELEKHVMECLQQLREQGIGDQAKFDLDAFDLAMTDSGIESSSQSTTPEPEISIADQLMDVSKCLWTLKWGRAEGKYQHQYPAWYLMRMLTVSSIDLNIRIRVANSLVDLGQDEDHRKMSCLFCQHLNLDNIELSVSETGERQPIVGLETQTFEFPTFMDCERHSYHCHDERTKTIENLLGMHNVAMSGVRRILAGLETDYEFSPVEYNIHELDRLMQFAKCIPITDVARLLPLNRIVEITGHDSIRAALLFLSSERVAAPAANVYVQMERQDSYAEYNYVYFTVTQAVKLLESSILCPECPRMKLHFYYVDEFIIPEIKREGLFTFRDLDYEERTLTIPWLPKHKIPNGGKVVVACETNDEMFPNYEFTLAGCQFLSTNAYNRYLKNSMSTATSWLTEIYRGRIEFSRYENIIGGKDKDGFNTPIDAEYYDLMKRTTRVRPVDPKQDGNAFMFRNSVGTHTDDDPGFMTHVTELNDGEKVFLHEVMDQSYAITPVQMQACKCHHCGQGSFFQFGTRDHHVCYRCHSDSSICDYCMVGAHDNSRRNKIYLPAFFFMLFHYREFKGKWFCAMIKFLRSCGQGLYLYLLLRTLLGRDRIHSFVKIAVRGLSQFFRTEEGGEEQAAGVEFNSRNFETMMFKPYHRCDEICRHKALFKTSFWEYSFGEKWVLNDGTEISIYPCKNNCELLNRYSEYRKLCVNWVGVSGLLLANVMDGDSVRNFVPFFALPPLHSAEPEYKPRLHDVGLIRSSLATFFQRNATRFGLNPTSSWSKILLTCGSAILGVIVAVRAVFELVGWLRGSNKEEQNLPPGYSRGDSTRHFKRKQNPNPKTKSVWSKPAAEEQSQSAYFAALSKKIFRNQLIIEVWIRGVKQFGTFTTVGIRNRVALMPKHYYKTIEHVVKQGGEELELRLYQPFFPAVKTRTYVFDPVDFIVSENADLCIFNVPKTVAEFANILPYIQTEEDCERAMPSTAIFMRCAQGESVTLREIDVRLFGYEKNLELKSGQKYNDVLCYEYSESGACGSLVLKKNTTRPIVAMHFAGTSEGSWSVRGYGMVLSQSTFEDVDFGRGAIVEREEPEVTFPVEDATLKFDEGVVEVQSLFTLDKEVHLAYKSKIRPSLLNKYDGEPLTRPCFLSAREDDYPHDESPMVAGCAKHGILTKNFSTSDVNLVRDVLWEMKYSRMIPSMAQPRKLTIGESIRGFGISGYEQMKLNTSMGYPYIFNTLKQKKDYVFITDEQEVEARTVTMNREVYDSLVEHERKRQMGIVPFLPYVDELKDERRKPEKMMKLGGTRVFCMSAFSTVVATRRNFLHFAAAYKNNRFKQQHAVGTSWNGPEWSLIANALLANSGKIVPIDYSNFGPGYNAMVCAAAHDIIQMWTEMNVEGVNANEMNILGEEHYNSLHLMVDLLYQQLSGGPSGDPLTVVKNGLVNELYILLAWLLLARKYGYRSENGIFHDYFKFVVLFTYGDDGIMSIHDSVIEWFNGITIHELLASYDITVTDSDKNAKIQKYKSIYDCTFLKAGFVHHPLHDREWLAPIDMDSVTECPRWIMSSDSDDLATIQNCEQAVRLCYGHGPEIYEQFRQKVNAAMREKALNPVLVRWEELDRIFFPQYY